MIWVDGISYSEYIDRDLIELARYFNWDFGNAIESKFRYYESDIQRLQNEIDEIEENDY